MGTCLSFRAHTFNTDEKLGFFDDIMSFGSHSSEDENTLWTHDEATFSRLTYVFKSEVYIHQLIPTMRCSTFTSSWFRFVSCWPSHSISSKRRVHARKPLREWAPPESQMKATLRSNRRKFWYLDHLESFPDQTCFFCFPTLMYLVYQIMKHSLCCWWCPRPPLLLQHASNHKPHYHARKHVLQDLTLTHVSTTDFSRLK